MIIRLYECDLCRESFNPNGENIAFGLVWKHDSLHVVKELRELEHHICIKCFQTIRAVNFPT